MGVVLGVGLLILVTAVALALATRATRSVAQFREERHENFLQRGDQ